MSWQKQTLFSFHSKIKVHFENLKQRLHADETFKLSTQTKNTTLEGPEKAEAIYPQKLGMRPTPHGSNKRIQRLL